MCERRKVKNCTKCPIFCFERSFNSVRKAVKGCENSGREFSDNIVTVASVTDFRYKSMKMGGIALAVVGGVGRWLSAESAPNGEGGRCGRAKKQEVFFRRLALAEGGTLFEIGTGAEVGVGGVWGAVAAEAAARRPRVRGAVGCISRVFMGRRTKRGGGRRGGSGRLGVKWRRSGVGTRRPRVYGVAAHENRRAQGGGQKCCKNLRRSAQ